jgi:hypothetical protein
MDGSFSFNSEELDCKNKRYSRQAIWAAGAARARSIPAAGCDERATKPAAQRANEYVAYFCNQALVGFELKGILPKMKDLGRLIHLTASTPKVHVKLILMMYLGEVTENRESYQDLLEKSSSSDANVTVPV